MNSKRTLESTMTLILLIQFLVLLLGAIWESPVLSPNNGLNWLLRNTISWNQLSNRAKATIIGAPATPGVSAKSTFPTWPVWWNFIRWALLNFTTKFITVTLWRVIKITCRLLMLMKVKNLHCLHMLHRKISFLLVMLCPTQCPVHQPPRITIHQLSSHHLILVRSLYCQTDLKNCNTCWSFIVDCVSNCRWSYPFDKQNWFSSRHTRKTNPRIYSPLARFPMPASYAF